MFFISFLAINVSSENEIPGMPVPPSENTYSYEVRPNEKFNLQSLRSNLPDYSKMFTPNQQQTPLLPSSDLPQTQIFTTPISLPGMPPITVSASLPQSAAYYSPVPVPENFAPTAPPAEK